MRVRVRDRGFLGHKRIDSKKSRIDDIVAYEDILSPGSARVSLFFRGENSSGIIDIDKEELDKLVETINEKLKFLGKSKKMQ